MIAMLQVLENIQIISLQVVTVAQFIIEEKLVNIGHPVQKMPRHLNTMHIVHTTSRWENTRHHHIAIQLRKPTVLRSAVSPVPNKIMYNIYSIWVAN